METLVDRELLSDNQISSETFPWSSKTANQFVRLCESNDWVFTIRGADEIERELLVESIAKKGRFFKLDCTNLSCKEFEHKVFGKFQFTKNEKKIIVPGIADFIDDGVLLLENFDQSAQNFIPVILDSKEGRRLGPMQYDKISIRFKMIVAFDQRLPTDFNLSLSSRLRMGLLLEPLSERHEDLVPVLKFAIKRLGYVRDDLKIADSFWQKLESRKWPLTLGQWVDGICTFFSKNVSSEMTWAGFINSHDVDFESVITAYDRRKKMNEINRRAFLIDRIDRAESRDVLLGSLGLSWERLVEELKRLGLAKDGNICRRLLTMPFGM